MKWDGGGRQAADSRVLVLRPLDLAASGNTAGARANEERNENEEEPEPEKGEWGMSAWCQP